MVTATRINICPSRFIHVTGLTPFADQYYHIYNIRLKQARPSLVERSRFRWGNDVRNVPLEQLNASLGSEDVFVVGTLFKKMPNQPSILKELEESEVTPIDENANFTSDDDSLILHETDENVQVVGDINPHELVTGIPVSLLGHQLNGGAKFHVTDICYAGPMLSVYKMPPPNEMLSNGNNHDNESKKVLIISGLHLNSQLTSEKDQSIVSALLKLKKLVIENGNIDKVIIAGNSTVSNDFNDRKGALCILDKFLFALGQGDATIDILPGKKDPTTFLLPQQPFHPKIIPQSSTLENIHPTTNPCALIHKDLIFLGTSGDNVDAIRQHTKIEYSTTILKNTLEWGHIAPLAPDNLSCMPFRDLDPFIIDFVPDIYFAGNQSEFAVTTYCTETKPKIQIISVPKFFTTKSCVQVDVSNLEVEEINFSD